MIPDSHLDLVTKPSFAHVATIGPDGEPQSNPVWIDGDAEHVRFSQTTTRQKYRNVQREPRVAMSMIDLDNPYRYLEVRGRVVDVADDADNAFIDKMASKYLGVDEYPYDPADAHRVIVTVTVEHTTHMN